MAKSYKNFKAQLRSFTNHSRSGRGATATDALLDDFESSEELIEEEMKRKVERKIAVKMRENLNQ